MILLFEIERNEKCLYKQIIKGKNGIIKKLKHKTFMNTFLFKQASHDESDMPPSDSSASKPNLKPKPSEIRPHADQQQQQQQPPLQPQYQQHSQNPIYSNPPYYQQQPTNPVLGLQYPQDQIYMQPHSQQQQQQQLALYQVLFLPIDFKISLPL